MPAREATVRPRILLLAYSISPVRGSEYSVGWNHVVEMSKHCDLTVLYGLAGPHMGDIDEIEDYLRTHGEISHVRFVAVRPNPLARLLNAPNRAGVLAYSFYLAYRIWHGQAARRAYQIIAAEGIDVIHYLCPIGYREPGFLWRIDMPYVWGPIGGLALTMRLSGAQRRWRAGAKTMLKNLLNRINLATSRRVARALTAAEVVIAATTKDQEILYQRFGVASRHLPENAIPDAWVESGPGPKRGPSDAPTRLIWIGRLDSNKSPDLLLNSLARVRSRDWHLDMIGTGALLSQAKSIAAKSNIKDLVTFHGQISREEVRHLLEQSDLHLITSMREANTTVIWEAMGAGVPTLSLDHCGMHDVICESCGIRVQMSDYESTCERIAAEISTCLQDPAKLKALSEGVVLCRERHLWSRRVDIWMDIYREAVARHGNPTNG